MGVVSVTETADKLPFVSRFLQNPDNLPGHVTGQVGNNLVVDQRRGGLVTHADTGRCFQGKLPVIGSLPDTYAELFLNRLGNPVVPVHCIDDIVAEPDNDLAFLVFRQESVERNRALNLHARNTDL